jgi:hypothetical protein
MKLVLATIIALSLSGCGKTLDQIKQVAHSLIDISGKIYEDVKDNANTAKDAVMPEKK